MIEWKGRKEEKEGKEKSYAGEKYRRGKLGGIQTFQERNEGRNLGF